MSRAEFESIFTNIKEIESQCIDFKSEVIVTPASIVIGIVEYAKKMMLAALPMASPYAPPVRR